MNDSVAVLGLGNMGSALARAFLASGVRTVVWNRTASKADTLINAGARGAPDARSAVAAASVNVICLDTYSQVRAVLNSCGTTPDALAGKTIVNLTWGDAGEGTKMRDLVEGRGGSYIDGDVLDYPSNIGSPSALLIFAGSRQVFDACSEVLTALGRAQFVGDDPGAANAMGMAGALFHNVAVVGFYEAAAYAAVNGVSPRAFLELTSDIGYEVCDRALVDGLGHIESGDLSTDQSTIDIHYETARLQRKAFESERMLGTLNQAVCEVLESARSRGHGSSAMAAVYTTMLKGAHLLAGGERC